MRWLIRVFDKSFVQRFYQAHLLAFLFVALTMFGMVDGNTLLSFHFNILLYAFSFPFTLFCIWVLWFLYALNGLRYMYNTLAKAEFQVLFTANCVAPVKLLTAISWSVIQINAPVIIYGGIGVAIAFNKGNYLYGLLGSLGLLFNISITVLVIYYYLLNTHKQPFINVGRFLPQVKLKPTMFSIMLRHIANENKVGVIVTKVFSCAVIYGAHYEWRSFNYDIRWMQVAMAISIPAQGVLVYQLWNFETTYIGFSRNFPVTIWKRYFSVLSLIIILLIPEMALLAAYCFRFNILWQWPVYALYAAALPMLVYAMLFTKGFNKSYNPFLFAMGLATFFVTLFGLTWLLALAFIPIGFMVYKEAFYDFEVENE